MHQISMDRWSRGILVKEVGLLYDSSLPELPVQYADFALWQREHPVDEKLLDWWKEKLLPLPPVVELPIDRPRPPVQSPRGRMQFDSIPQAELDALQILARREGATLFMVLLAGLATLLHRTTGTQDLIVGAPVANRHRPELDGVIGFFLNLLPLRLHPRPDRSFRDLLSEARETAVGAFAHQEVPFERLVDELDLDRDLSRHPLFQVTLALQNAPIPPLRIPDLTATLVEVDWGTTAFDLALFFWETALWESLEPGLSFVTTASAALFDAETVTRLAGDLRSILRDTAADPDRRLADLLPGEIAKQQILAAPQRRRPSKPVEPRTEIERLIVAVWSEILDRPVGVEDDFFDLGGHSLQAMRIVERLKKSGIDTTVRALFEARTVAILALTRL